MNTKTCSIGCKMDTNCFVDLVNWKQPIKTIKVFGGLLTILYLIKNINLVNNLFWFGYISLLSKYILYKFWIISFRANTSEKKLNIINKKSSFIYRIFDKKIYKRRHNKQI